MCDVYIYTRCVMSLGNSAVRCAVVRFFSSKRSGFFFFGFLGYLASGGFVLDSCGKDVRGCFLGGEGN